MLEHGQLSTAGEIPNARLGVVLIATKQTGAIGADRQRNKSLQALDRCDRGTGPPIPDTQALFRNARQAAAVRRPDDKVHLVGMTNEGRNLPPTGEVPKFQRVIFRPRNEPRPIGTETNALDGLLVAAQHGLPVL